MSGVGVCMVCVWCVGVVCVVGSVVYAWCVGVGRVWGCVVCVVWGCGVVWVGGWAGGVCGVGYVWVGGGWGWNVWYGGMVWCECGGV